MVMHCTCGEPDEIKTNTHPENTTALPLSCAGKHEFHNEGMFTSSPANALLVERWQECNARLATHMREYQTSENALLRAYITRDMEQHRRREKEAAYAAFAAGDQPFERKRDEEGEIAGSRSNPLTAGEKIDVVKARLGLDEGLSVHDAIASARKALKLPAAPASAEDDVDVQARVLMKAIVEQRGNGNGSGNDDIEGARAWSTVTHTNTASTNKR